MDVVSMYNRKDLKKEARQNIKLCYFHNVIVVFICTILLAGGFNYTTKNILNISIDNEKNSKIINNSKLSNGEIINEIIDKAYKEKKIEKKIESKYTNGVI